MLLFFTTGILKEVKPAKNPAYLILTLLSETLKEDGTGIELKKEYVLVDNSSSVKQRLHLIALGDTLQISGIGERKKNSDEFAWIASEIKPVNCFMTLDFDLPFMERKAREMKGLKCL